jgi:hypothetical protein
MHRYESPREVLRRRLGEIFPPNFDLEVNAAIVLDSVQQSDYKVSVCVRACLCVRVRVCACLWAVCLWACVRACECAWVWYHD